jgi:hypothetical protein
MIWATASGEDSPCVSDNTSNEHKDRLAAEVAICARVLWGSASGGTAYWLDVVKLAAHRVDRIVGSVHGFRA